MIIETRDFGTVAVSSEDIIRFDSPIYGFEELKEYVFLYEEENQHIVWLQSVENPHICFVLADPSIIAQAGGPAFAQQFPQLLGEGEYWVGLVVVVAPDFKDSTVNLRSPVVVNLTRRRGMQVILDGDYPIRAPLFGEKRGQT